jgi:dTDP-4-dehydrorhamnose 3,5-epimerase
MKIEKSKLEDCFVITPKVFEDHRGYFFESFNQTKFNKAIEKRINFIQDNESKSDRGVLRGLHFQLPPYTQAKLVRVIQGKVLDVAVDIRKNSPTYGQHHSVILSADNKKQFFVPKGFAHGYAVLSETAIFSYKIDSNYMPSHESGILWNDKDLKIDWRLTNENIILSDRDKSLQSFKDFDSPF